MFQLSYLIMGKIWLKSLEVALLSLIPGSITCIKKEIFSFLLMAGRALIPRYWKSAEIPTIRRWVAEVNYTMCMEELVAIASQN